MKHTSGPVLGVDVGGTDIKLGLVDSSGVIHASALRPTEAEAGPDHALDTITRALPDLLKRADIRRNRLVGAGIGAPGPMSFREGRLLNPGNLPGWEGFPIRDRLADRLALPVIFDNDANMAALGESWIGAGRNAGDLVLLTLGTGVGSGILLEGEVLRGHFENAAELGHMIVVAGGRQCSCGQLGCLEAYASAGAIASLAEHRAGVETGSELASIFDRKGSLTSADVAQCVKSGDETARRIWSDACRVLAVACVNIQHVLNVQMIVFGGGMSGAGTLLLDTVRAYFDECTWTLAEDQPRLVLAELGNDAGIIGAARAVFQAQASGQ